MSDREIIIINESVLGSAVKDLVTFAMFAGLLYFNHEYLSGSLLIDILFILCVLVFLVGRSQTQVKKFNSYKVAIEYLRDKE